MKKYVLKRETSAASKLPYESELNEAQYKAVMFNKGPLLVIAGAGSGKTKTLVYRVARLIESGVAPESILLLTFTRRSAQEMLRRASGILDTRCDRVSGGTFHSFSNLILRRYGKSLGYSEQFTILDRSDSEDLINMIRKDMGFSKMDKRFPKKNTLLDILSKSVNTQKAVSSLLLDDYPQFFEFSSDIEAIGTNYRVHKRRMQVLDYDDLLVDLLTLLQDVPEARAHLHQTYRYIMVDEYQDTNAIQSETVYHLAGEEQNVMVVGDDSQSIYSFRGADFQNIMNFPARFPGTTLITLEENYRSTQPILDLTNAVIGQASEKYTKSLFSSRKDDRLPVYIETPDEHTQTDFVCQKILELREEGVKLDEIAVLFRSGWHANELEIGLKSRNIPYVKYGGIKFIEAAHIKDVLSFLRIIQNRTDRLSWQRVLLLIEGIGPKAASDIISYLDNSGTLIPPTSFTPFAKKPFYADLERLAPILFAPNQTSPTDVLASVISFYRPFFKLKYDDYPKREMDLDSLITIAERYQSLETFLTEMSLDPPDATQIDTIHEPEDEEKLIVSTIHSAKGLEWKVVFLLSAVDGYLPSFQSIGDPDSIEEERRLLYVALTRAKDQLFILKPNLDFSPQNYYRFSGMAFSKLSRFLEEGDLLGQYAEKWALVEEGAPDSASTRPASYDTYYERDEEPDTRKYIL